MNEFLRQHDNGGTKIGLALRIERARRIHSVLRMAFGDDSLTRIAVLRIGAFINGAMALFVPMASSCTITKSRYQISAQVSWRRLGLEEMNHNIIQ